MPDGTVIESKSLVLTEKKVGYKQDWPAYNLAQPPLLRRLREVVGRLQTRLASLQPRASDGEAAAARAAPRPLPLSAGTRAPGNAPRSEAPPCPRLHLFNGV